MLTYRYALPFFGFYMGAEDQNSVPNAFVTELSSRIFVSSSTPRLWCTQMYTDVHRWYLVNIIYLTALSVLTRVVPLYFRNKKGKGISDKVFSSERK